MHMMNANKLVHCVCFTRKFHVACVSLAGKNWRLQHGLPPSGNEYGPLVDIPDWSYADGRPAPIQSREKKRREKRKQFATQVQSLMEEMKQSKAIHQDRMSEAKTAKEKQLEQKLKPKIVNQ